MIPVNLSFSGLNSYRQIQNIDFKDLAAQGLFGIFGVTGAGKSTILDAITLALFGEVRRALRQTQGIINVQEKTCFVSFSFELGEHVYRAERLFEREKNKAFSCRQKSCRLIMDDELTLADKGGAMDDAVKELLNMDCNRFCQTVILPQGEFDQILRFKPAERSAMLEKLFHFGEYGEVLGRRCRTKLKISEAQVSSILEQFSVLGEHDDDFLKKSREQLDSLRRELAENDILYQNAQKSFRDINALAAQNMERKEIYQRIEHMMQQKTAVDAMRKELALANKAEPLRDMLERAVSINNQITELNKSKDQKINSCNAAKKSLDQAMLQQKTAVDEYLYLKNNNKDNIDQLKEAVLLKDQATKDEQALAQALLTAQKRHLDTDCKQCSLELEKINEQLDRVDKELGDLHKKEKAALASWQQAQSELDRLKYEQAAAYLAAGLREDQACPVCGSLHHPHMHAMEQIDLTKEQNKLAELKELWDKSYAAREVMQQRYNQISKQRDHVVSRWTQLQHDLSIEQKELDILKENYAAKMQQWRNLSDCDDPQQKLLSIQKMLDNAETKQKTADEQVQKWNIVVLEESLSVQNIQERTDILLQQMSELRVNLVHDAHEAGFADANTAQKALRAAADKQKFTEKLSEYDANLRSLNERKKQLDNDLKDFSEAKLEQARRTMESFADKNNQLQNQLGRAESSMEKAEQDAQLAHKLQQRLQEAQNQLSLYKRLDSLLRGNAFVRFLSRNTMSSIAHEASEILMSLTSHRFRLELFEDNKGSDFIIVDNYNGGVYRQTSGLSGGETFLVSMSLALALSRKIQMSSTPLGFFFLDEGFGSLDEKSLDYALSVLEKLPSKQRSVGIITHVQGVKERVPRYLEVLNDPVQGSYVKKSRN